MNSLIGYFFKTSKEDSFSLSLGLLLRLVE